MRPGEPGPLGGPGGQRREAEGLRTLLVGMWGCGPSGCRAAERPVPAVERRRHLVVDALEVCQPGIPELELHPGQGVQPVQQGLGRVFAQHVPDLMGPVDDDGLDGMKQRVVLGGGEPASTGSGRCCAGLPCGAPAAPPQRP